MARSADAYARDRLDVLTRAGVPLDAACARVSAELARLANPTGHMRGAPPNDYDGTAAELASTPPADPFGDDLADDDADAIADALAIAARRA